MGYHSKVLDYVGYYSQALAELVLVSDVLWKMDKVSLPHGCFVSIGTNRIVVYDSTKETYHAIIEALNLGVGEKEADSSNITTTFKVDKIEIVFSWSLPESCEVIYDEKEIPENEIIRTRKTVKEVICQEPLMQSVFPDWVEKENGNVA